MSTVNAVPFLANSAGTDLTSLGLKMYWGSVVEAYRNGAYLFNTPSNVIARKTVTAGKSWQFLMMADLPEPDDFTPGDTLAGQAYAFEEGTITADGYVVSHAMVPKDQIHYAHFDAMGMLGASQGARLARKINKRLNITGCLAARTASASKNGLTIHNGGNRVTRGGSTSGSSSTSVTAAYPRSPLGASNFRSDLRLLARRMDEDQIPREGRLLIITPYMHEVMLNDATYVLDVGTPNNVRHSFTNSTLFSEDYARGTGNDVNTRTIRVVEGFQIVQIENWSSMGGSMPDENIVTGPSKYQANFTPNSTTSGTPVALALCAGQGGVAPIGMVIFEGLEHDEEYLIRNKCYFMAASVFNGAGVLHPWCAGSIEVTNDTLNTVASLSGTTADSGAYTG